MSIIYCLYSTADGKPRYIGQTTKFALARQQQHLGGASRRPNTLLHRWIAGVVAQGFQVRIHALQLNVHPADLNLFERYWMGQFAGLLNTSRGVPLVRKDTSVGAAVTRGLRRRLQDEGPQILGRTLTQPQILSRKKVPRA